MQGRNDNDNDDDDDDDDNDDDEPVKKGRDWHLNAIITRKMALSREGGEITIRAKNLDNAINV